MPPRSWAPPVQPRALCCRGRPRAAHYRRVGLDGIDSYLLPERDAASFRNEKVGLVFQDHLYGSGEPPGAGAEIEESRGASPTGGKVTGTGWFGGPREPPARRTLRGRKAVGCAGARAATEAATKFGRGGHRALTSIPGTSASRQSGGSQAIRRCAGISEISSVPEADAPALMKPIQAFRTAELEDFGPGDPLHWQ